LKRPRR